MIAKLKSVMRTSILPRPKVGMETKQGPIVVAGMFRTASGLGQSAWSCVEGLEAHGHCVVAVDLSEWFNQVDLPASSRLQSMPTDAEGTLILHANWPEVQPALTVLGLRRWHNWKIIGYWAWELDVPPKDWQKAARHLSEIWVPSRFVADAFTGHKWPVKCVPHRVVQSETGYTSSKQTPSSVLVMADGRSSFERKNLSAALAIYQKALGGNPNWKLQLKLRNLSQFPDVLTQLETMEAQGGKIELIDGTLPRSEIDVLISSADILLSPHRSEGFGLHLAEAMAHGVSVMATDYSGNVDFMTEDNAVLLPHALVPVKDRFGVYSGYEQAKWADVDIDVAAKKLASLAGDHGLRERLGRRARADIAAYLSGKAYGDALLG